MPKFAHLLCLGLLATLSHLQAGESAERPNTILYLTDDQGWGDVGHEFDIWPKRVTKNRTIAMPCSTSDYFPTVMAALGHSLPEQLARPYDGVSLLPLIKGEMKERPRPIGFESRGQVSLTDNRWKLISYD